AVTGFAYSAWAISTERMSYWLLAWLGFLFHTYIGYVVITSGFAWCDRLRRARGTDVNGSRRGVLRLLLRALIFGPPVCFVFVASFVFYHSMRSAPQITNTNTAMTTVEMLLQKPSWAGWPGAAAAVSVIGLISVALW